jgi:hypothetical protein
MQLRPKLLQLRPGTRIVSHDFDMGDWEADKVLTVDAPDKPIGLEKKSKVYSWVVPAHVEGLWCGAGKAKGRSLAISQRHQLVRVDVPDAAATKAYEGRITGSTIRTRTGGLQLAFDGQKLKATHASGTTAPLHGGTFTRAKGQSCG